jgi:hypothetical protein
MDSSGTDYSVYLDEGIGNIYYTETPLSGPSYRVDYFDCADFDAPFLHCRDPDSGPPQVAVGGPASQRVVYVSYMTRVLVDGDLPSARLRLGIKKGTQWTFEDPPISGVLRADPQGRAWLGTPKALFRRDAANSWTRIPIPCGVELSSFVIDPAGAAYIASGQSSIWRRDSNGSWAMEATPGRADSVYAGGGTIHYSSLGFELQDGSAAPVVRYGRRVGTAWQQYDVQASPVGTRITEYQMALDRCGAPHFSIATLDTSVTYYWTLDYVRWTTSGWRSTMVADFLHDPSCALGVSPNYAIFTYSGGGAGVPLR